VVAARDKVDVAVGVEAVAGALCLVVGRVDEPAGVSVDARHDVLDVGVRDLVRAVDGRLDVGGVSGRRYPHGKEEVYNWE
jgi:hypothetical protein